MIFIEMGQKSPSGMVKYALPNLCFSKEVLRTLAKKRKSQNQLVETLKINHMLMAVNAYLLKTKYLALKKGNHPCGILTCPISISFSPTPMPGLWKNC